MKLHASLGLLALFMTTSFAAAAPGTEALISRAQAALKKPFRAVQRVESNGRALAEMKVWSEGNKRRYEFEEPPVRRGDLIVDNGRETWIYHRGDNSAVQTLSMPRRNPFADGSARSAGQGNIGGRETNIIEMRGGKPERVRRKIWLDEKTNLPLRIEHFDGTGQRRRTITFSALQSGDFPDSVFRWTPPADANITRTGGRLFLDLSAAQSAASWLQYPRALPGGFAFESAIINGQSGEAWLRYASANRRFSIFQQRAQGENKAAQKVRNVWFWQRGGSRFTVVGLNDDAAQKLIADVK